MKPPSHLLILTTTALLGAAAIPNTTPPRQSEVQSILTRCQACHGTTKPAGNLSLMSRAAAIKGGKSGPALTPKDSLQSPLYLLASSGKMPPGNPLSTEEVAALKKWIDSGAAWDKSTDSTPKRAGLDWWSLKPVVTPAIPIPANKTWVRNPIDAFIAAGLQAKGLQPAPPADRRTLIRRAFFDLTGLPPSPADVAAFLADNDPLAYEKLIDRLLASPHYGERWGRHWLDVARFGESMGYEYDHIRDNAWRYRDYVVQSFNSDKPYFEFLREQIAGDVLPGAGDQGVIATGFLVAGPMDEAGKGAPGLQVRLRAREEEMEDIIGLVGQTCLGLTVNCSRCHDHKFDPITQKDYYRLKSALSGVNPGNRPTLSPAEMKLVQDQIGTLKTRLADTRQSIAAIENSVRDQLTRSRNGLVGKSGPKPFARWSFDSSERDAIRGIGGKLAGGAKVVNGRLVLPGPASTFMTDSLPIDVREKTLETWVTLPDLAQHGGSAITIEKDGGADFDGIVYGERERGKWIAGSGAFYRTKDLGAPIETEANKSLVQMVIVYKQDNSIEVYRNGKPYAPGYIPASEDGKLRTYPAGKSHLLFGLRHTGAQDYLKGEIDEARLYDRALTAQEVAESYANAPFNIPDEAFEKALSPDQRQSRHSLVATVEKITTELKSLENLPQTYAAISQQPAPTKLLVRGDVQAESDVMNPGGLSAIRACSPDFGLAPDSPEAERRIKLANWVTDPRNPLTARVMVNRLWQYHFGHGIVGTANDFGFNGERPTHPALLDWLASRFIAKPSPAETYACDGSIKKMHRLMMLSNTYRQSGTYNARAAHIDSDNRLLWRYAPRRLEAEVVRDSMLFVSGQLNLAMGGPSFRPFVLESFNANQYRIIDPQGPEFNRRTLYRMSVHSARSPLLESLDCPDPSTKTPKRTATTTPIQALELMNDSFILRQANAFAELVRRNTNEISKNQIRYAYVLALGRYPNPTETQRALQHLKSHNLESFCWALFNSSEFLYAR